MGFAFSFEQILEVLGKDAEVVGDAAALPPIEGIAALNMAQAGDLSFLGNPKYRDQVSGCAASLVLVPKDYSEQPAHAGQTLLKVENPSMALALICREIEAMLLPKPPAGVHPTAIVDATAEVDPAASVGPGAYIGPGARIEGGAVLRAQSTVEAHAIVRADAMLCNHVVIAPYCEVGPRCRIMHGAVIGSDGFGYAPMDGQHVRVPQVGRVVLEADVDVGANTTIDRARFGVTRIGQGTKIDNLVQIGHNVEMGKGCLIVAQVGISGSTRLGDYVVMGGKAGISGHLNVGDGAQIAGGAGVVKDLDAGAKVAGYPSMPFQLFQRTNILRLRLPDLFKRFDALERSVQSLENSTGRDA